MCSPAATRDEQPFVTEHLERFSDGNARDLEVICEIDNRGKFLSWRYGTRKDGVTQDVCNLDVKANALRAIDAVVPRQGGDVENRLLRHRQRESTTEAGSSSRGRLRAKLVGSKSCGVRSAIAYRRRSLYTIYRRADSYPEMSATPLRN